MGIVASSCCEVVKSWGAGGREWRGGGGLAGNEWAGEGNGEMAGAVKGGEGRAEIGRRLYSFEGGNGMIGNGCERVGEA